MADYRHDRDARDRQAPIPPVNRRRQAAIAGILLLLLTLACLVWYMATHTETREQAPIMGAAESAPLAPPPLPVPRAA